MKKIHLAAIALAAAGLAGCSVNPNRATNAVPSAAGGSRAQCAALPGTQLGFGTVDKAEYVAHGEDLVSPEKKAMHKILVPDLPPLEIRAPRSLCRVTAELRLTRTGIALTEALLSRASDFDADLIVMGAYGHPRWTERVLGGMTQGMLASMTVPVLMSH